MVSATVKVPLPQPKPELHDTGQEQPTPQPEPANPESEKPAAPSQPPFDREAALACEAEIKGLGVNFTIGKDISGDKSCGLQRPVHLKALKGQIDVTGDPVITCGMARGLAQWMARVVVPSAELHLKARPTALHIGTSYQCRGRNGSADGKISEHAFGNAVDISGLSFAERGNFVIEVRTGQDSPERAFQAAIRGGACAFFTTVLGPTTNDAHNTHLHLDLIARRNNYRICE